MDGISSYAYSTYDTIHSIIVIQNRAGEKIIFSTDCIKGNSYERAIERALEEDGMIRNTKKYSYKISNTVFKVNGEVQSESLRLKYLNLLLENSCLEFESEYYFKFEKPNNRTSVEASTSNDE